MAWFRRSRAKSWPALAGRAAAAAAELPPERAPLAQALHTFYTTPPPAGTTPLDELPLIAIDVETTGLDAQKDRLLSVGIVNIDGRSIPLETAQYWLVRPEKGAGSVGQSATIHGLTDEELKTGERLESIAASVITAASGRVLLAHLALIEHDFISAACQRLVGIPWTPEAVVDTMDLERREVMSFGRRPGRGEMRLMNARKSRGLPDYHNHNALIDALACAELYLAQTAAEHFGQDLDAIRRRRGTTQW